MDLRIPLSLLVLAGSIGAITAVTTDCSVVLCGPPPECKPEDLVTPPGQCCPICVLGVDCLAASCLRPFCEEGETLEVPEGKCCPVCVPVVDCSAVSCPSPLCEEGEMLENPEGVPVVDCSAVFCPKPLCEEGETLEVPEGKCCPVCVPVVDCSAVSCPRPVCEEGEILEVPKGECCPVCFDPCAVVDCALGSACKVDVQTKIPFCEPSCEISNGGCAKNQICQLTVVQCVTTPCPPTVTCLSRDEVCSLPEKMGPCEAAISRYSYNSVSGQCEPFIYGGCQGNANNFESLNECEMFCVCNLRCPPGHRCEVDKETGETFCNPDCELDNGGCSSDQICSLLSVQCVRSPCPPTVQCSACKLRCPPGHRCEVDKETGETFCNPDCELDNGGCWSDEICSLLPVQCVRSPCPPTVQCSACKLRCPPGHRCEVDKGTGETFCNPDCELDNGGCSSDQICSLLPIVCVRAPCPPAIVQCSCPPECSRDYCTANRKGLCSNPAYNDALPRPGCTGSCRLTYCSACIFGVENPTIPSCPECADYSSPNKCYEKWSQCIGRNFQDQATSDAVFCASPPCLRKG